MTSNDQAKRAAAVSKTLRRMGRPEMAEAEAFRALNALAREHKERLGVQYRIGTMVNDYSIIALRRTSDKKGNGAVAMRELCAFADKLGVELTLATSRGALVPYFESFGFRAIRKHNGGARVKGYGVTCFVRDVK